MKNIILLALIILGFVSCRQKGTVELEFNELYRNNIIKRITTLNKLGEWEYSPNKKDSIWNQTDATHNLNLLETVFQELEPLEREWDSLIFLSKKYDSIPSPSEEMYNLYLRPQKRKIWISKWKLTLEESVDKGLYSSDGKKLN